MNFERTTRICMIYRCYRKKRNKLSLHRRSISRICFQVTSYYVPSIMHYFEYYRKSPDTLEEAKMKYPWLFSEWLSDESIETRYHLLEHLYREYRWQWKLEKDKYGMPIPILYSDIDHQKLYWCLSHSLHFTAFIISDSPTGIDIAEYEERDESLFGVHSDIEYSLLSGKKWKNFYILWTAKEAIIKIKWGKLDDMKNICLQKDIGSKNYLFEFLRDFYKIICIRDKNLFLSHIVDTY